jgi:hypothetical protein
MLDAFCICDIDPASSDVAQPDLSRATCKILVKVKNPGRRWESGGQGSDEIVRFRGIPGSISSRTGGEGTLRSDRNRRTGRRGWDDSGRSGLHDRSGVRPTFWRQTTGSAGTLHQRWNV